MNQANPRLFASTPFDRILTFTILAIALCVPILTAVQTAGLIR